MIAVTGDELGGGVAAILLALLILVLAIVWMLFPILLLIKFNDLVQVQRAIPRALLAANAGRDEIAKALQGIMDNWRKN